MLFLGGVGECEKTETERLNCYQIKTDLNEGLATITVHGVNHCATKPFLRTYV